MTVFARIFNPDNGFFRTTGKLVDVVLLSLIWLVVSLPIITIGPASTALYYVAVKCLRNNVPHPYKLFFECFKANFKVGALTALILAVTAFALLCGYFWLYLYATAGGAGYVIFIAYCVLLFLLAGAGAYLFPVLSRFTFGVGGLFGTCFKLAIAHLPSTLVFGIITCGGVFLSLKYWVPVLVVPMGVALLQSVLMERIFLPFMQTGAIEDIEE